MQFSTLEVIVDKFGNIECRHVLQVYTQLFQEVEVEQFSGQKRWRLIIKQQHLKTHILSKKQSRKLVKLEQCLHTKIQVTEFIGTMMTEHLVVMTQHLIVQYKPYI